MGSGALLRAVGGYGGAASANDLRLIRAGSSAIPARVPHIYKSGPECPLSQSHGLSYSTPVSTGDDSTLVIARRTCAVRPRDCATEASFWAPWIAKPSLGGL